MARKSGSAKKAARKAKERLAGDQIHAMLPKHGHAVARKGMYDTAAIFSCRLAFRFPGRCRIVHAVQ